MTRSSAPAAAVRLRVSADLCPQITLRVLGLLAQRSIIPERMSAVARPRSMAVEIDLAAADTQLIAKIEGVVGVRRVRVQAPTTSGGTAKSAAAK